MSTNLTNSPAAKKALAFLKKVFDRLTSTSMAGLYLLLFAAAIGAATFIENDFGTSSAQKVVFKTRWFEALLVLFGATLVANIFRFRMWQQRKFAILTFHASIIVILVGSALTRYLGSEGMMGIREGEAASTFLSQESYLTFEAEQGGRRFKFYEPVLFSSLGKNTFKETYRLGGSDIGVELLEFIPNPAESMVDDPVGIPILKVVIGGAQGREEYPLRMGERANIHGTLFNFGNAEEPAAFNILYENNNLTFKTAQSFSQTVMATQQRDTLAGGQPHPLALRALYTDGEHSFVFGDFRPKARVEVISTSKKTTSNSRHALRLRVTGPGGGQDVYVVGAPGAEGQPKSVQVGATSLAIGYGARRVQLPFSIRLRDFQLEKYPGTDNASSYASEVTLTDPRKGVNRDQRIYMNHVLDHDGYRFFQSSFDQDELGTYLSLNHDFWGTWVSYLGYALLTLGMVLSFFDPKSRFRKLGESLKKSRGTAPNH